MKLKTLVTLFKNKLLVSFLLVIVLLPAMKAYAENQSPENVKFKHISVEDGLTHHETLYVYQDSQGFLWFGTKYGLNKYDGMTIKPYFQDPNPENKNSLAGNFVHWIQEDSQGSLWISTWGDGISKYDPGLDKFTNYRHNKNSPDSLASNNVWSIFVDSKGFVWSATDKGVSILNPNTKTFVNYEHDPENPDSLSNNKVSRIREDAQGIYWISTYGGGLNRFDPKTKKFKVYKHIADDSQSLSNNNLWGVFVDSKNRVWIASESGLNLFHPETETFTSYKKDRTNPESLSSNTVTVMCEDRHGKLWLGTFGGGLNRFDPENGTFNHFRHDSKNPFSLSNDIIMGVWEAQDGAIWVATYGGIDKYDPGEYQFEYYKGDFHSSEPSTTTKIRSVYQDKNGYIWLGTGGDGLNQLTKNRKFLNNYQSDRNNHNTISDNDIWAIAEDKNGHIWLGTHGGGLNQLDPANQSFVRYKHDPENPNTPSCNSLYDLAFDKKRDVLWIASYLTGLDKFDLTTKTFTHYKYNPDIPDGIVSNWVTAVFVDSKSNVWVGTEAGLSLFNPDTEKFTNFKHDTKDSKSLSANMIQTIYQDSKNNVWIGTSGGLNRYSEDAQSFERFSQKDGLAGNHIAGIVEDNNGFLWISTDSGISKFDPVKKVFRNYNKHDGLQGDRFLMHSIHRNDQGELFFGGTNGFNIINPGLLEDNQNIPEVVLTDFQIFNQTISVGGNSVLKKHINKAQQIVLDHKQNVFSFEFVALNFRNSPKNQYAYKMEGFDKDYQYTNSNRRVATYTNLDPGQYIFRVLGSNNDGLWKEEGTSLKLIIKPPWWKTLWFKLSLLILGFILVLSVFKYIHRLRFEITERKRAEIENIKTGQKYKTILQTAIDGFWITDLKGNLLEVNAAYSQMSGYSIDELLTMSIHQLDGNGTIEEVAMHLDSGKKRGFDRFESVHRKKDNSLYDVEINFRYLSEEELFVVFVKDISEQKKLQKRIMQAQKMESIGTLAGGIAHDFNNILFPIIGNIEMLQYDIPEDSPFLHKVDQIHTSALRASDLVKQILTFSRQEQGELKLMKIQPVIKEALKLIRSTIPTTIDIKQDIHPDCSPITGDPTKIHQIIMNLATNAAHAMEEKGGALNVRLRQVDLTEPDIFSPNITPGTYVCLSVSDTGKGMDEKLIQKIFDPFFTTKEVGKGTGMGLSVIHGIVTEMKGDIKVYSEPEKGTEFHAYLPAAETVKKKQQEVDKVPIKGGTEHILLLDDEKPVIELEQDMLERLGYTVEAFTDSLEALDAFKADSDRFDLVITDMAMPNMAGDKLAVELIKIRADIPVLLCTGFSETMYEEKAASLGIKGFLLKPVIMKDLAQKIREVLDK